MKLSVIMPVFNEISTVGEILKKVRRQKINKEIIVVDDFSTDGTREFLKDEENNETKIIFHPRNSGKGRAIRTGLNHVSGDIVIIQDADLEYDPRDYHKLIVPIITGAAGVVYGSRVLTENFQKSYHRYYLGGRILTFLTNFLYQSQITDEPTCYKVFKTEIIKSIRLTCEGFEFCPEVTAKLLKKGYDIYEVPVSYSPRSFEGGKKIKCKDGMIAIFTLFKNKFYND